jgi:hypothetical protein
MLYGDTKTGKSTLLRSLATIFPRAQYCSFNNVSDSWFNESPGYFDKSAPIESTPFDNAHLGVLFLDDLQALPKESQPRLVSRINTSRTFDFSANIPTPLQLNLMAVHTNHDGKRSKRRSDAMTSMSGAPDGVELQFPLVFPLPSQSHWEDQLLDFHIEQEHNPEKAVECSVMSRRRDNSTVAVPGLLAFVHRRVGLKVQISMRIQSILKLYSQRAVANRAADDLHDPRVPLEIMTKAHATIFSRRDANVFDALSAIFIFDLSRGKQFRWLTPAFCDEWSAGHMQAESVRALREMGFQH